MDERLTQEQLLQMAKMVGRVDKGGNPFPDVYAPDPVLVAKCEELEDKILAAQAGRPEPSRAELIEAAKADVMSQLKGERLSEKRVERCPVCDWPLKERTEDGCVAGNCSYRPREGTEEYYRIEKRRQELANKRLANDAWIPDQPTPLAGATPELRDCPFCNTKPRVSKNHERHTYVGCDNLKGCFVFPATKAFANEEFAYQAWNGEWKWNGGTE